MDYQHENSGFSQLKYGLFSTQFTANHLITVHA